MRTFLLHDLAPLKSGWSKCLAVLLRMMVVLMFLYTASAQAYVIVTTPGIWTYVRYTPTGSYVSPPFNSPDGACADFWASWNGAEMQKWGSIEPLQMEWYTAPMGVGWCRMYQYDPGFLTNAAQISGGCVWSEGWYNGNDGTGPFCYKYADSCPAGQTAGANGICSPGSCTADQRFSAGLNACLPALTPKPKQAPPPQCTADVVAGNPIYPLRGVKREIAKTPLIVGRLNLQFSYDSTLKSYPTSGNDSDVLGQGAVGELWSSNLHRRAVVHNGGQAVTVMRGNGSVTAFMRRVPGSYTSQANVNDRLFDVSGGGYRFMDAAAQSFEIYDAAGNLISIQWASGEKVTLSYSDASTPSSVAPGAGFLIRTQDTNGRYLHFAYDAAGRLTQAADASTQEVRLGYGPTGMLASLAWSDNATRLFLYEHPAHTWALTGTRDENFARYATFGYDSTGRAISTEHAGEVDRFSVSYGTPPAIVANEQYDAIRNAVIVSYEWKVGDGIVVVNPIGSGSEVSSTLVQGVPHLTRQTQPAGSGCAASAKDKIYDINGNAVSETDFNGVRICRAHDLSRNLEITRVEGAEGSSACPSDLATYTVAAETNQRKTTTQWHPAWSMPITQAEPKKITISVYNGQPDPTAGNATASCAPATALLPDGSPIAVLCKKVEQATTDATGSLGFNATVTGTPRTWTYAYNQYGQLLTARDPLNKLTTYAYYSDTTDQHTMGDLQSITDSAGRITQYTRYDKSGRLMQSVDANGTVIDTTYTSRGWVKTVRVTAPGATAQASLYDYDGVGQLKKATLPDGSALEYTYDAAHRLTSVKDAAGNSVTYTLDNMGNRTGEDLRDPSGTLARNITRVYDALNRVQGAAGAAQ